MKKIGFLFSIAAVVLFSTCSKSSNRPAPVNCDNLITDTAGTNDNAKVFAVTAFTPNGDGHNDLSRVITRDIASFYYYTMMRTMLLCLPARSQAWG